MKKSSAFMLYGALAVVLLCVALFAGYMEERVTRPSAKASVLGTPLTKEQIIERRRAAIATPAIADATAR